VHLSPYHCSHFSKGNLAQCLTDGTTLNPINYSSYDDTCILGLIFLASMLNDFTAECELFSNRG
jgi:hypothetical protein